MKRLLGLAAFVMTVSLASMAIVVYPQAGPSDADLKTRRELMKKLSDDKKYGNVNISVDDGVATLFGTVASVADRQDLEKKVKGMHGVSRVNNLVNVMASSGQGSDEQILREAIKRIRTDPYYSIYDDVNLSVQNGVVTLSGEVWQPARKPDYEKRLSGIPGVKQVRNELKVSPTSIMDDRLRYYLTRAVYSHPGLQKYAIQPDPPIHLIINNQRVTITGVVNSEVDKALVNSIVNGFTTFQVTNNLRVEGRERTER